MHLVGVVSGAPKRLWFSQRPVADQKEIPWIRLKHVCRRRFGFTLLKTTLLKTTLLLRVPDLTEHAFMKGLVATYDKSWKWMRLKVKVLPYSVHSTTPFGHSSARS